MSTGVVVEIEPGAPSRRREALAPLMAAPFGILGPLVVWPALVVHLVLPMMAAGHLAGRGGRARFAADDRPRIADATRTSHGTRARTPAISTPTVAGSAVTIRARAAAAPGGADGGGGSRSRTARGPARHGGRAAASDAHP